MIAASPQRVTANPFPGLRSFTAEDTHLFFGREGQSDEILRRMAASRFVAIVGSSGCGKSSLLRAGLLPALEEGYLAAAGAEWRVVDMKPGSEPLERLAAAAGGAGLKDASDPDGLRSSSFALVEAVRQARETGRLGESENVLFLVDQFEEIFRYRSRKRTESADRDEKATFVRLLVEASRSEDLRIYVVITMRSDFLGDCARFRDLPEAINEGQYLVPRMSREQRKLAIEGPIRVARGRIAPRLVQRLLNEAGDEPDNLPVLQHALMRSWNVWRRSGADQMDFVHYEEIGGIAKALDSHLTKALDEVKVKLPERGEEIAKRIFQRLRERDFSGRETRRPTALSELISVTEASREDVITVLECFRRDRRSFLMPPANVELKDDDEVEVTHEALLRVWSRLKAWGDEEDDSKRMYLRLVDLEEQGRSTKRPEYLRGALLAATMLWWNTRKPNPVWAERYSSRFAEAEKFLNASEEGRRKERRRTRMTRVVVVGLFVAMALGSLVAFAYMTESSRFEAARNQEAQERERQRALVAKVREEDATRAKEAADDAARKLALEKAAVEQAQELGSIQLLANKAALVANESATALPVSLLLAAASMKRQYLLENQSPLSDGLGLLAKPLPLPTTRPLSRAAISAVSLSPDGKYLAAGYYDQAAGVELIDIATSRMVAVIGEKAVNALSFAAGSKLLATRRAGQIEIFDVESRKPLAALETDTSLERFAFSPNGATIVAWGPGKIQGWTGGPAWTKPVPMPIGDLKDVYNILAVSHDGKRFLQSSESRRGTILSSSDGSTVARLPGAFATNAVFDPSSSNRFAFWSGVNVALWDMAEEAELPVFLIHPAGINSVSFSSNGNRVVTTCDDGVVRVWNPRTGREVIRGIPGASPNEAVVDSAGRHFASLNEFERPLSLWSMRSSHRPLGITVTSGALTFDGKSFLGRALSRLRMLDVETGGSEELVRFEGGGGFSGGITYGLRQAFFRSALSRDGLRWATFVSDAKGKHVVTGMRGGKELWRSLVPGALSTAAFDSVEFSPNGKRLRAAIRSGTRTAHFVFDADSGASLRSLGGPGFTSNTAFSPDSKKLLSIVRQTSAGDGARSRLVAWDLSSGEGSDVLLAIDPLVFSNDGKLLAVGEWTDESKGEGKLRIFRWPEMRLQAVIQTPARVRMAAFSPDGLHIATTGVQPIAQIWRIDTKKEVARVKMDTRLTSLAFSKTGERLVCADTSTIVSALWQRNSLLAETCQIVGRNLTAEEWNRYAPGQPQIKVCP